MFTLKSSLISPKYNEYAYLGRSYAYAPDDVDGYIYIYADDELKIGDVIKVEIIGADEHGLTAKVLKNES